MWAYVGSAFLNGWRRMALPRVTNVDSQYSKSCQPWVTDQFGLADMPSMPRDPNKKGTSAAGGLAVLARSKQKAGRGNGAVVSRRRGRYDSTSAVLTEISMR